jgi:hypothetical protein
MTWFALSGYMLGPWDGGEPRVFRASFDGPEARSLGTVLEATGNGVILGSGPTPIGSTYQPDAERLELEARVRLRDSSRRLISLVTIRDASSTPRMSLAIHGEDLVWWERRRARALGFDLARPHLFGAFASAGPAGDVVVGVQRDDGGDEVCLWAGDRRSCGFGVAPERSWTLLRSREHSSESTRKKIDVAWMATLTVLIGILGGGVRPMAGALGMLSVATVTVAAATPLTLPGLAGFVGLAMGLVGGVILRPLAARFLAGVAGAEPPREPGRV